jgi:glucose/mannose-6-phosphate isomerase
MKARFHDLDRSETYTTLDPTGLRYRLRDLPVQCREAWAHCSTLELPGHRRVIDKVVIGGMGGSAIAGDLVTDLAASRQPAVPFMLVRDFSLPFKLDDSCLFIACSYSGTTEETLSLFRQAVTRGASILAITSGGTLAREAGAAGMPLLSINASGESRSAVGYNLMLLLGALSKAGIMTTEDDEVQSAVAAMGEQIARCNEEVPSTENPAKLLAQELADKLIVIYGGGLFSALARRWKTQLNENAKAWAFFEAIPELLHNSVEAYHSSFTDVKNLNVLLLQPSAAGKELDVRYDVVAGLLHRGNVPHRVLKATGHSSLAQLLSMLVLGDYVSYYLALLKGLDPSPTPFLQLGKELLNSAGR